MLATRGFVREENLKLHKLHTFEMQRIEALESNVVELQARTGLPLTTDYWRHPIRGASQPSLDRRLERVEAMLDAVLEHLCVKAEEQAPQPRRIILVDR